jgi:hypothetical protein
MTITVNTPTIPTFTQAPTICAGDALTALPTTSNNGVTGTWSPALDNMNTTTYTFTPTAGQCATTATMTITVNSSPTAPTFTQVAAICSGDALSALPTTSNNAITGTWSPALDNMNTTTYTFTPTAGQCATTATMTITVNPSVTPTFTQVAAICAGDALSALPTTSNNGVTGTWSPAVNNMNTTTYTFTPTAGQCAATATMTITVNTPTIPTFTQVGPYCVGDTPAVLPTTSTNGVSGTWNAAISTASAGTVTYTFTPTGGGCTAIATMDVVVNANTTPTFSLVGPYCVGDTPDVLPTTSINGVTGTWDATISTTSAGTTTYTFTPTGGCSSPVTMDVVVNVCVGINEITMESVLIYPNPASEVLIIETSNVAVNQVKLINILGETLVSEKVNNSIVRMNVKEFAMGVYFVQLTDNKGQILLTEKVSIK